MTKDKGTLHGTWHADNLIMSSDRRLKNSIVPLYKAIAAETTQKASPGTATPQHAPGTEKASTVDWVLRQLRPVSFKFKHGPEGKYSRYGFVAQELQQVLPGVVRGQGDRHLSVVYQDMIALLTLAAQVLQDKVNQQEESITAIMKYVKSLDEKIDGVLAKQQQKDSTGALTRHMQELEEKIDRALLSQPTSDSVNVTKNATRTFVDDAIEQTPGWPHRIQI